MKKIHRLSSSSSSSASSQPSLFLGLIVNLIIFILILGCADVTEAGACWIKRLQNGKCKEIFSRNITKEECCKPGNDDFAFTNKELSEAEYFLATAIGDGTACSSCIDSCDTFKCSPGKRCVLRKGRPKCICAPICKAASKEKRKLRPSHHVQNNNINSHREENLSGEKLSAETSVVALPAEALLLPSTTSQKNDIRVIDVRHHHDKLKLVNFDENIYPKRDKRMVFYGIKREFNDDEENTSTLASSTNHHQDQINHQSINNDYQINHHIQHRNHHHHPHQHQQQRHHEQSSSSHYPSQTNSNHPSSSSSPSSSSPSSSSSLTTDDYDQTESSQLIDDSEDDVDDFNDNIDETIILNSSSSSSSSTSSIELLRNQRQFHSTKNKNNKFINNSNHELNNNNENSHLYHDGQQKNNHKNQKHHQQHQHHQQQQQKTNHRNRHHNRKNVEFIEKLTPTRNDGNSDQHPNYKQMTRKSQNIVIKANINDDYGQDHYSQFRTNNKNNHSIKLDKLEKSINSDNNQIYSRNNPIDKFIVNYSSNEFNIKNHNNNNNNNKSRNNRKSNKNIEKNNSGGSNHHRLIKNQHKNNNNNKQQQQHQRNYNNNHDIKSKLLQQSIITMATDDDIELIEKLKQQNQNQNQLNNNNQGKSFNQNNEKTNLKMFLNNENSNATTSKNNQNNKRRQNSRNHHQNHQHLHPHQHHHYQQQQQQRQQNQRQHQHSKKHNNKKWLNNTRDIQGGGGGGGSSSSSISGAKNNYQIQIEENFNNMVVFGNRSRHQKHQEKHGNGKKNGLTLDEKIRNDYFSNGFSYPQYDEQIVYVNPVCGTDGRTYRSECQLKKRACRQDSTTLTVAYRGYCQTSCKSVKCQQDLTCVEDQYGLPHCIKCSITCPNDDQSKKHKSAQQVCGYDGQTYDSICHLNRQVCITGRSVGVAYNGPCIVGSTCETVSCGPKRTCLKDLATNQPRCVTCSFKCPRKKYKNQIQNDKYGHMKICGNNNHTYHSWCHMRRDSCNTDLYIDIKHIGGCHKESFIPSSTQQPDSGQNRMKAQ